MASGSHRARCGACGQMLRRRGAHSGKFLPKASRDALPLMHAAAKSEPHARGNRTRAERARARRDAMTARLRAEIAAGIAPVRREGETK